MDEYVIYGPCTRRQLLQYRAQQSLQNWCCIVSKLGAADLMPGRGTGASLGDRGLRLRGNLATGRKKRTEFICRLFKGPASLLLLSSISKKRGVNKLKTEITQGSWNNQPKFKTIYFWQKCT
jgi:hypothetical protein